MQWTYLTETRPRNGFDIKASSYSPVTGRADVTVAQGPATAGSEKVVCPPEKRDESLVVAESAVPRTLQASPEKPACLGELSTAEPNEGMAGLGGACRARAGLATTVFARSGAA